MAPRPLVVLLAVPVVLGVLAGPASAAQFVRDGTALVYTAAPGDVVDLTTKGGPNASLKQISVIAAAGSTPMAPATSPCSGVGATRTCNHLLDRVAATLLQFKTGAGDDKINASGTVSPFDSSLPTEFVTGAGRDTITGGPKFDSVFAGPGDDRITGGGDADALRGEADDDTFVGLVGDVNVLGGPGTDLLDLSAVAAGGMSITLNGAPDDGPLGAQANVDVENVRGTADADLLTGGDGPNVLEGDGGGDVIDVRGGGLDEVDCGPGADRALADGADLVTGCETVEREAPPAPPPPVDADGDGVIAGVDCDDASPARRPGARDIPGNRIDEDCSGADSPLVAVPARVSFLWAAFRDGTEARTLRVRSVPAGGRVQLRCSARRACGFTRRNARVKRDGVAGLLKFLRDRRLPAGLVVEVRVSAPEHITSVTRFVMRARKVPRKRSLCLPPGADSPERCKRR